MLISVIVPMYNSRSTIENTIKSIITQTYTEPIEIIVVNDGSTDSSEMIVGRIIEKNNSNRVLKLINKENGGVSSARNAGVQESSGEWIAFLDSDDLWHPQKVDLVIQAIEKFNISFVGHGYTLEENFKQNFKLGLVKEVFFMSLLLKNFAVTPSIVIKKELYEAFDEKMTHTEDHDLWLRLALKTKVYYLDIPLVVLGRPALSSGGLSANKWSMRKGEMQMYKNIVLNKKSLLPLYPFLIFFSLLKHLRQLVKG